MVAICKTMALNGASIMAPAIENTDMIFGNVAERSVVVLEISCRKSSIILMNSMRWILVVNMFFTMATGLCLITDGNKKSQQRRRRRRTQRTARIVAQFCTATYANTAAANIIDDKNGEGIA